MVMAPPPCMTQQYSWLPWLHRHLPPHSFLTSPQSVSPQSTAALTLGSLQTPQTPAPSRCALHGTLLPVWGMYGCGKDCLILIPFGLPQVSCFTLSLKYFSSGSDPLLWGSDPCLSYHKPLKAGPVLLTLLFSPLVPFSHRVLHSSVYSFPLVKYYCLLSAGVLHALLCLKVYS